MSVATTTETRTFGRLLTMTRDAIMPGVVNNAYDNTPLMSALTGKLNDAQFGPVKLNGRGKKTQEGGESVRITHQLGKNSTIRTLSGPWGTVDTTPQDNARFSRSNWTHYSGTATVNKTEELVQTGGHAIASIVDQETTDVVMAAADAVGDHAYSNGGDATRITSLQQIISANDAIQGLSGATFARWNSRGVSARGTAASSVSFTSGSFASQGITDMRKAYLNCTEGSMQPHGIYTTHLIFGYYEASLQPQERFTSGEIANAGFQQLAFKSAPVFADSKCTSGEMYFINFDALYLKVLAGADFTMSDFIEAQDQEAYTSKLMFKAQLCCSNRYLLNKLTGITA